MQSVIAIKQMSDEACSGADQQGKGEQKKSHQDCADNAGGDYAHSKQDDCKEDRSQCTDEQGAQCGTQTAASCAMLLDGCGQQQDCQISDAHTGSHPEKCGVYRNGTGDLQERCNYTDDETGDCGKNTAGTFTVTQ